MVTIERQQAASPRAVNDAAKSIAGEDKHPARLIVATFNIRYGVGAYLITGSLLRRIGFKRPRRRAALVARHLREAARALSDNQLMPPADIVALQEADKLTTRAGGKHIAVELAMELNMQWAHLAADIPRDEEPQARQWYLDFEERIAPTETGSSGLAILSRSAIKNDVSIDLPFAECAWRPRFAMAAIVSNKTRDLHIFNSHIDPHASIDEQLAQHEAVLRHADAIPHGEPLVLLGDFNTLSRASRRAMRRLLESRGFASPMPDGVATWRAGLVRLHTDWIFVRGACVTRWGVARGLSVSDHWPVWAEIELGTGANQ